MLRDESWSQHDTLKHLFEATQRLFITARRQGL